MMYYDPLVGSLGGALRARTHGASGLARGSKKATAGQSSGLQTRAAADSEMLFVAVT